MVTFFVNLSRPGARVAVEVYFSIRREARTSRRYGLRVAAAAASLKSLEFKTKTALFQLSVYLMLHFLAVVWDKYFVRTLQ